jgi:hypothetical protein
MNKYTVTFYLYNGEINVVHGVPSYSCKTALNWFLSQENIFDIYTEKSGTAIEARLLPHSVESIKIQ